MCIFHNDLFPLTESTEALRFIFSGANFSSLSPLYLTLSPSSFDASTTVVNIIDFQNTLPVTAKLGSNTGIDIIFRAIIQ